MNINSIQPSAELKLLTFNVWGLKVGRLPIARSVDRRMEAMVQHICALNADVIALQEVWCDTIARYFVQNLRYPYYYYQPNRKGLKGRMGNGLIFLSKFPILEQSVLGFSVYTRFDEYFANKGALMIQIDTGAGKVNLINTHLGAGKRVSHIHERMHQMDELQGFIRSISRQQPLILAGDFNFNSDTLEYMLFKQWLKRYFTEMHHDAYPSLNPARPGHTFFVNRSYESDPVAHDKDERIDYTFALGAKENRSSLGLTSADTVLDFPDAPLSDHCGLMTHFSVIRKKTLHEVLEEPVMNKTYEVNRSW